MGETDSSSLPKIFKIINVEKIMEVIHKHLGISTITIIQARITNNH